MPCRAVISSRNDICMLDRYFFFSLLQIDIQASLPPRRESTDHFPAPATNKNSRPINIQKSARPSCAAAQNPCACSIGHLVVMIATEMMPRRGKTAKRTQAPSRTALPQTISVARSHSGDSRHRRAMKRGFGADTLPAPLWPSLEQRVPLLGNHARKNAGAFSTRISE